VAAPPAVTPAVITAAEGYPPGRRVRLGAPEEEELDEEEEEEDDGADGCSRRKPAPPPSKSMSLVAIGPE
jgi:hypothetical protein